MNDTLKTAAIVLVASMIGGFVGGLVGNQPGDDLGASGTRFPNGISADTTSPSGAGNFRGTTLTVTGASTLTGAVTASGALTVSGVSSLATTSTEAFTQGGDNCTLTDANGGAVSLTQELLNRCSYFTMAAGGQGQEVIQLTPVATSSLTTFIPNAGDCKEITYDSSALAAATTTTHTATAGHILIAPTVNDDLIDGGEYSNMRFCRRTNTDITLALTAELVDAD